jgi:hypothetical protein
MRGELDGCERRTTRQQVTLDHIAVYLADPTIALDLIRAVRRRESWR